ncbi:MAG: hypothetical protein LBB87_02940 [Nitrososphaerota archaeon]|jgi:hypothetical protein|nr:hypothetical protein [Nitrososphaerota archaeon]
MKVKLKSSLHSKHQTLLATSLLGVLLVSSLFVGTFMNGVNGDSLENAIHVKNEDELKNAINNASSKGTVIALDNDITLANDSLTISANKVITLTGNKANGFYKLIGAFDKSTITVEGGVLQLDGIIVTHTNDAKGVGVYVMEDGWFIMYSGEISGNTYTYNAQVSRIEGGGVCIWGGVFELYGGAISNNKATGRGGGVYNANGMFKMFGGEISNNKAIGDHGSGGGVFSGGSQSVFELHNGKISNNKADYNGGGVARPEDIGGYMPGHFNMFGGEISDNTAAIDGGGIYSPTGGTLLGGTITGNTANRGGGVFGSFSRTDGVISGNTAKSIGNDVYPEYPDKGSSGGNGGSSNGNGGSTEGNGDGSGNWNNGLPDGGSSGSSNGNNGQSIWSLGVGDVLVICVIIVVAMSVAMVILFVYFQKRINQIEKKQIKVYF